MDEEVQKKFELLDQQINRSVENINSRFDIIKWYVAGIVGMVVLIFVASGVIFAINYNTDRSTFNTQINRGLDELRQFQDNIKEYIKLTIGTPEDSKIELYSHSNNDLLLKDQKTVLTVTVEDNIVTLNVGFIIKNLGNAQSGLLYFKVYLPEPFNTKSKSADEPMFKYEYHINPEEIHPNVIPGNYISTFHLSISVGADVLGPELKAATYPAMIKVYYGKGKVTSAPVFFVIDKDIQLSTAQSSPPTAPSGPSIR
jgi:hypothetical protein